MSLNKDERGHTSCRIRPAPTIRAEAGARLSFRLFSEIGSQLPTSNRSIRRRATCPARDQNTPETLVLQTDDGASIERARGITDGSRK